MSKLSGASRVMELFTKEDFIYSPCIDASDDVAFFKSDMTMPHLQFGLAHLRLATSQIPEL